MDFVFFGSQYNITSCLCACVPLRDGTKQPDPAWGWCQFYQYDDYMQKKRPVVVHAVFQW